MKYRGNRSELLGLFRFSYNNIKMKIYRKLRNLSRRDVKYKLRSIFLKGARLSYAQSGEDMILDTIFNGVKKGFYIDIGANNPFVQSNTYHFYKEGWNGINIDALPNSMKSFNKYRRRDINIENAISDREEVLEYHMFSSTFYNSFSKEDAEKSKMVSELLEIRKIKTQKLSDILDKHSIQTIDFMSIDVEGFDLNVLKSNDWVKYRPKVIVTECFAKDFAELKKNEIYNFLKQKGYIQFCNTPTNMFYLDNSFFAKRFGINHN
jgi:FkbM family methyltransferase